MDQESQNIGPTDQDVNGQESHDTDEAVEQASTQSLLDPEILKALPQEGFLERCMDRGGLMSISRQSSRPRRESGPALIPGSWRYDEVDHERLIRERNLKRIEERRKIERARVRISPIGNPDPAQSPLEPMPTVIKHYLYTEEDAPISVLDEIRMIEPSYCGYVIEKAAPNPVGGEPSWKFPRYRRQRLKSSSFRAEAIRRARMFGNVVAQYDEIRPEHQKDIDRLLKDFNNAELDKRLKWVIASVRPLFTSNSFTSDDKPEYDEVHVIIKRIGGPLGAQAPKDLAEGGKMSNPGDNDRYLRVPSDEDPSQSLDLSRRNSERLPPIVEQQYRTLEEQIRDIKFKQDRLNEETIRKDEREKQHERLARERDNRADDYGIAGGRFDYPYDRQLRGPIPQKRSPRVSFDPSSHGHSQQGEEFSHAFQDSGMQASGGNFDGVEWVDRGLDISSKDADSDVPRKTRRNHKYREHTAVDSSEEVESEEEPEASHAAKEFSYVSGPDRERKGPEITSKGILKSPRAQFPESAGSVREGVAPLDKTKWVPGNARWTRVSRALVSPKALDQGNERYEVEGKTHVIVLRVLTREEIQHYAELTKELLLERGKVTIAWSFPDFCTA